MIFTKKGKKKKKENASFSNIFMFIHIRQLLKIKKKKIELIFLKIMYIIFYAWRNLEIHKNVFLLAVRIQPTREQTMSLLSRPW